MYIKETKKKMRLPCFHIFQYFLSFFIATDTKFCNTLHNGNDGIILIFMEYKIRLEKDK